MTKLRACGVEVGALNHEHDQHVDSLLAAARDPMQRRIQAESRRPAPESKPRQLFRSYIEQPHGVGRFLRSLVYFLYEPEI